MSVSKAKPFTKEELYLFDSYLGNNWTWGSLHIVLEDFNVEDAHVQSCIECAERENDHDGLVLAKILLTKSKSQRIKLGEGKYKL